MNLRELVDTVEVPETRVADDAWMLATRRLARRRTIAAAAVSGMAVAVVLVAVDAATPETKRQAPGVGSPSPSVTTSAEADQHLPVTITRPDWEALGGAPELAPGADVPALSEDPVDHAALVMGDPADQAAAFVLGDDGRWRRLDVEGGIGPTTDGLYTSSMVRPTGLNADGTRLAIPQPGQLVVVDLTTGEATRFGARGPNHFVLWVDDTHVLVGLEGAESGTLVDTTTGEVQKSDLGPTSRVTNDGDSLTWPQGDSSYVWKGGTRTSVVVNGGVYESAPLVRDELALITTAGRSVRTPPLPYPPAVMLREVGIAAVDLPSGDPVGFIPLSPTAKGTSSVLLGWRGEDPVLALVNETMSSIRTFLVVWDVHRGAFEPLATLPSWDVSWGIGL